MGEIVMRELLGLLLVLALAASTATVLIRSPNAAVPIATDYSGATF
jgi:hypothetical protein